jgi:glutathione S-transferase
MLQLFYTPGACSLASHIALEEAGADYTTRRVDLKGGEQRRPEFLAINPKGRVPALATDKGVLTESPVILGYIAQTFPDAKLADNDDSFAFGDMQAFNLFLATTVHVAYAHIFRPERYVDGEEAARAVKAKGPETLRAAFALIEEKLSGGQPFVQGAGYTVADCYLFIFENWFESRGVGSLAQFTNMQSHRARVAERDAVRKVLAAEAEE